MKVLVTGGAGFIGSHLVDRLVDAGHQVSVLDKLTYAAKREYVHPEARLYVGDISDRGTVGNVVAKSQPDAIYHLAAETHVQRSIFTAEEFLRANVFGTFVLLDEALAHWTKKGKPDAFRFVNISTDEVFGSLGADAAPWTEASQFEPNNPYSASKAAGEHLVRAWNHTYGLPTVVTRSANNFGPRQHEEKLVATTILRTIRGETVYLHGNGLQKRDWLDVRDHAEALERACRLAPGTTVNLPGAGEHTNLEVVCAIQGRLREMGYEPKMAYGADRPGNDLRYAMSGERAQALLGWKPKRRLLEELRGVIEWYVQAEEFA
jgi:dTDP-glucose 4,6-dehydratase